MEKERIDQLLVEKGLFESRTKAQSAILAGIIYVDDKRVDKAGHSVPKEAKIEIKGEKLPYVSRGGLKLEHALKEFKVEAKGLVVLDVGSSTGGFTDCVLSKGASHVYAIDVGYGQLAWKLRNDPRVTVVERTNARNLRPEELYKKKWETGDGRRERAGLAVIDVSFISLSKILPAVYDLLNDQGEVVALVKPQFEAGREQVEKGGLVRNEGVQAQVLDNVASASRKLGFKLAGVTYSPIKGADGNIEFFVHLGKIGEDRKFDASEIVKDAHEKLNG